MSQHTTEWLNREFAEGRVLAADIRVLTLAPDVAEAVIHAIAQHLNESPSDTVTQVKAAWHSWCKLSEAYPQLKVRAYRSVPTMQGVFVDDSEGMIEMMSFHSPPKERVGLFISSERTPASFATFWSSAANLWDSSLSDQALGWA